MDRKAHQELHRRRLGITILVSGAAHIALLAWVTVDVPDIEEPERTRITQLIELTDAWQDQPLEVVQLREQTADPGASSSPASEVGSVAVSAPVAVKPALPSVPTLTATLSLTPVEGAARPTVAFSSTRGVVKRRGEADRYRDADFDFEPASAAAREAERRRGGDGREGRWPGSGGTGVTISGGIGGDCATPLGGAPNGTLINRVLPGRRLP
jgi:hypothetical protein